MFSKLHERLGTAGFVVALVALVAALAGTAFAAAGLNGTQKKEVKKIAKKFAGKNGATGPQGPVGPSGAAGASGKNGADGQAGAPGAPGAPGAGVVAEEEPAGLNCPNGGWSFEVEGSGETQYVCNGESGAGGGGSTLEPGEEEKGVWSLSTRAGSSPAVVYSSIQFPRTLPGNPKLTFLKEGATTSECPGNFESPAANAETTDPALCVYVTEFGVLPPGNPSLALKTKYGLVQEWNLAGETEMSVWGTWAAEVPAAP
jgi:hypothetical protein